MTAAAILCPNPQCGCPVQSADVFCPHCGQVLDAGPVKLGAQMSERLTPELAPAERIATAEAIKREPITTGSPQLVAESPAQSLRPERTASSDLLPANESLDLDVRYNNSCVFVLNMQSTFDFEIQPLADGIKNLFVEVRQSSQVLARETPMVVPRRGSTIAFGLNYTPRHTHSGKVSFTILVGYRKNGQQRVFAAYRTHTIHSGKEDPRRVCENLVVEVKNNIHQGHAGDLKVDQSFDGLREALRQHNPIEIDKEFLGLINARPIWTSLPLAECEPDAVLFGAAPASPTRRQRLDLQAEDGTRLGLLTQTSVRIGRHRDCEILARLLDGNGQELRAESSAISQYHALIDWNQDHCQLKDGGHYPEGGWRRSTAGVWVDGKPMSSKGEFTFVPGREHRITLGDPAVAAASRYELSARLWSARDLAPFYPAGHEGGASPQSPVCLVLRRLNGPGWVYLVLRSGAALAWADPRLNGVCVGLYQGALHWSEGQLSEPLVAGRSVRAGALNFQVNELAVAGC